MFPPTVLRLVTAIGLANLVASAFLPRDTLPSFDGQYIHPNASNEAVEWWWIQALGTPVGSNPPPTLQLLFYQGYPIAAGPPAAGTPEFYVVANGFFPNGTAFSFDQIPASAGTVTTDGQAVTGLWPGAGSFQLSSDLSTFTVQLNAPGLTGAVTLKTNNAHHFGCDTTSTPYFSSAVSGITNLSAAENILFNQLGWATTIPGGTASVSAMVDGSPLVFEGSGYHDANWAPVPLNEAVSTWYFGSAQVGPYDLSFVSATALGSSRPLNTGYLSSSGTVLQNQCSVEGTKSVDISKLTPYGSAVQAGVTVPAGFILEYTLQDGSEVTFNLSARGANPGQNIYHRWLGTATGGKPGENFEGAANFEWLNPALVPYVPSN
ncbi:hypothetical protein BC834DRAFT_924739 [Gloeopeniophorella convolvens]|nr:hypothetical protein BC834DRAFT_924739 [Gloeopeniophorella convolvens]